MHRGHYTCSIQFVSNLHKKDQTHRSSFCNNHYQKPIPNTVALLVNSVVNRRIKPSKEPEQQILMHIYSILKPSLKSACILISLYLAIVAGIFINFPLNFIHYFCHKTYPFSAISAGSVSIRNKISDSKITSMRFHLLATQILF